MSLIIFLLVGLIAGVLASYIMGRQQDLLLNLLIGIIGAVVGGLLAGLLGLGAYNIIGEIILATIGALICILVWQRMRRGFASLDQKTIAPIWIMATIDGVRPYAVLV